MRSAIRGKATNDTERRGKLNGRQVTVETAPVQTTKGQKVDERSVKRRYNTSRKRRGQGDARACACLQRPSQSLYRVWMGHAHSETKWRAGVCVAGLVDALLLTAERVRLSNWEGRVSSQALPASILYVLQRTNSPACRACAAQASYFARSAPMHLI